MVYCLTCLNYSISMYFESTKDNLIYLNLISFDGFGAYLVYGRIYVLSENDSRAFLNEIASECLNQEVMTQLVKKSILMNKEQFDKAALRKYGFI